MPDLTRADIEAALKNVLRDRDTLAPLVRDLVIPIMTDKFEKTFGVDCTDHEAREEMRRNIDFLRYTSSRISMADIDYLKKELDYAQSDQGKSAIQAFKRLMSAVDSAAFSMVKTLVGFAFLGILALVVYGTVAKEHLPKITWP
jgi:oligoribonuclease NrnB/cAMP/cGMP phosphodiesterase (DHH superfamily)